MTYPKNIFLILFFVVVGSGAAFANQTDRDKDKKKQQAAQQVDQEKKDKATIDSVKPQPKPVSYSAASEKNREAIPGLKSKADSSSVLSYNFIFYLVYKFKYTESEEEFSQESRTTD